MLVVPRSTAGVVVLPKMKTLTSEQHSSKYYVHTYGVFEFRGIDEVSQACRTRLRRVSGSLFGGPRCAPPTPTFYEGV